MVNFIIPGNPIPKLRAKRSRTGVAYNSQRREEKAMRLDMMHQLPRESILRRYNAPISVEMAFHTPIPKSWSQKRRELADMQPDPTRPDIDNYAKFPLDVMNEFIFNDDNLVTELYCVKKYSSKPRTAISVKEHKVGKMVKEHAMTLKTLDGDLTLDDLNYLIKKANRLGLRDREVFRVFYEEDNEGKHVFFDCDGLGRMSVANESNI